MDHVNPKAVTLKALLELAPLSFVCSNPGAINLRGALPDHNLKLS